MSRIRYIREPLGNEQKKNRPANRYRFSLPTFTRWIINNVVIVLSLSTVIARPKSNDRDEFYPKTRLSIFKREYRRVLWPITTWSQLRLNSWRKRFYGLSLRRIIKDGQALVSSGRRRACLWELKKCLLFARTVCSSSVDFVRIKYLQQSELIDFRSSKVLPRKCDFRDKIMRETFLIDRHSLDLTKRLIFLKGVQFSKSTFRTKYDNFRDTSTS